MTPDWLQYGAVGLLALVLVGIGIGAREALGRWMDNQKAVLNHQADSDRAAAALSAERQAAADKFLQDLIVQDRVERNQNLEAMQSLVERDIEAKRQLTDAMEGVSTALQDLCRRQDRHEKRAEERHRNMLLLFEQQRKELS